MVRATGFAASIDTPLSPPTHFANSPMCANPLDLTCLEDRILFDVAPLDVPGVDLGNADLIFPADSSFDYDWANPDVEPTDISSYTVPQPNAIVRESDLDPSFHSEQDSILFLDVVRENKELIVVDRSVADFNSLIDQAIAEKDPGRFEVLLVDSEESALAQLNARFALSQYSAIHIISHGADGQIQLGAETWDSEFLADHRSEFSQWRLSLTTDADLLIYGCNVAESALGQSFVEEFAATTGTDIAASTDLTGSTTFGGDWQLEVEVGEVDTDWLFAFAPVWESNLSNQAPIAIADVFLVDEDTNFLITTADLIGNDFDPDGDPISLDTAGFSDPSHGDLIDNGDGTFTYIPAENFDGTDSFQYVIEDSNDLAATGSVTIQINPENDAPVAKGEQITVLNSGPTVIPRGQVLANDFDPDGDPLSIQIVRQPKNGELIIVDGELVYIPNPGFEGTDRVKYRVSDGDETSNKVTLKIKVTLPPQPLPESSGEEPTDNEQPEDELPADDESNESKQELSLFGIGSMNQELSSDDEKSHGSEQILGAADDSEGWGQGDGEQDLGIYEFSTLSIETELRFSEPDVQVRTRPTLVTMNVHAGADANLSGHADKAGFAAFSQELDNFDRNVRISGTVDQVTFATLSSITSVLTVGYVLWMVRGGMLMASFVSSIPAWQSVDPLNIVEFDALDSVDVDDESLESIVNQFSNHQSQVGAGLNSAT